MKAYERLKNPESWTQKRMARLPNGNPCGVKHSRATQWCMMGALVHCYGDGRACTRAYNKVASRLKRLRTSTNTQMTPQQWNDTPGRTHKEVYALLKELDI